MATVRMPNESQRSFPRWFRVAYHVARRIIVGLVGFSVLAFGLVLLVTPGPALIAIPLGLAILALEFVWARRWLRWVRDHASLDRQYPGQASQDQPDPSRQRA